MVKALAAWTKIRAWHLLWITAVSTFVSPLHRFMISSLVEINLDQRGRLQRVCGPPERCDRPRVLRDKLKWYGSVLGLEY
jgi:hypothetical protein